MATKLSQKVGVSKELVNNLLDEIIEIAKKEITNKGNFNFNGLGKIVFKNNKPKKGRNPQTGVEIQISERKGLTFRPSSNFINKLSI